MNESQKLVVGTIVSGRLGLPNINKIFTEEIIKIVSINPNSVMVVLISLLKITLIIASITWLIKLGKNIQFTYERHDEETFKNYLLKLITTAIITLIIMIILIGIL